MSSKNQEKRANPLPSIPVDPKLLEYPFPPDRHYKYAPHSLYMNSKTKVYLDSFQTMTQISTATLSQSQRLLNQEKVSVKAKNELDPLDRALLVPFTKSTESKAIVRPNVPWLRRTEYISSQGKQFGKSDGVETKMGVSIMKDEKLQKWLDRSRKGQIQLIEHTFDSVKQANLHSLKHPTNPDLKATEMFPIFPDFEFWPNSYSLATFDLNPLSSGFQNHVKEDLEAKKYQDIQTQEAILRPMQLPDDPSSLWFSYYVPSENAVYKMVQNRQKLQEEEGEEDMVLDSEEYEYVFKRDFDQKMVESNYPIFIELRKEEGGAFYSALHSKFILKRKRVLNKRETSEFVEKPTKILLSKRPMTSDEVVSRQKIRQSFHFE